MWGLFIVALTAVTVVTAQNKTCEKIPKAVPHACCSILDELEETVQDKECTKFLSAKVHSEKGMSNFSECILTNNNLLMSNKSFDMAAFKTFAKTIHPKSQLNGVEDKMKKCLQKSDGKKMCQYMRHLDCVLITVFLSCPEESWTKTADCDETKLYFENCPTPFDFMD